MNQTITLTLDANEFNFLNQVLGELPTKTGAFVLLSKLQQQVQAQVPPAPADAEAA